MVLVGRIALGDFGFAPSIERVSFHSDRWEPGDDIELPKLKSKRGRPKGSRNSQKSVVSPVVRFVTQRVIVGQSVPLVVH